MENFLCLLHTHLVDLVMWGKLHRPRVHLESLSVFHCTVQFVASIPQFHGFFATFSRYNFVKMEQKKICSPTLSLYPGNSESSRILSH